MHALPAYILKWERQRLASGGRIDGGDRFRAVFDKARAPVPGVGPSFPRGARKQGGQSLSQSSSLPCQWPPCPAPARRPRSALRRGLNFAFRGVWDNAQSSGESHAFCCGQRGDAVRLPRRVGGGSQRCVRSGVHSPVVGCAARSVWTSASLLDDRLRCEGFWGCQGISKYFARSGQGDGGERCLAGFPSRTFLHLWGLASQSGDSCGGGVRVHPHMMYVVMISVSHAYKCSMVKYGSSGLLGHLWLAGQCGLGTGRPQPPCK